MEATEYMFHTFHQLSSLIVNIVFNFFHLLNPYSLLFCSVLLGGMVIRLPLTVLRTWDGHPTPRGWCWCSHLVSPALCERKLAIRCPLAAVRGTHCDTLDLGHMKSR